MKVLTDLAETPHPPATLTQQRIATIALGYLLQIGGWLTMLSIPILISLGLLFVGLFFSIVISVCNPELATPKARWQNAFALQSLATGTLFMLILFLRDRIFEWHPNPVVCFLALQIGVTAYYHLHHLRRVFLELSRR